MSNNDQTEKELTTEQKEEAQIIAEEASMYQEIAHTASTPGGKILVRGSLDSVLNIIDALCTTYKVAGEREVLSLVAQLDANYTILKTLTNSKENATGANVRLARVLQGLPAEPDE